MEKILFISWSPKKWNTYRMLSLISDLTKEINEIILLKDKNIQECIWCWYCEKGKGCVLKDDIQEIMAKLSKADTIVLWSPNYFANVSWITKKFIDRLLPLYHSQALKGKNIFLVMPWASSDATNTKYLLQGTFWLVDYQGMKLAGAYGWCTEDPVKSEEKMNTIAKKVAKKISE